MSHRHIIWNPKRCSRSATAGSWLVFVCSQSNPALPLSYPDLEHLDGLLDYHLGSNQYFKVSALKCESRLRRKSTTFSRPEGSTTDISLMVEFASLVLLSVRCSDAQHDFIIIQNYFEMPNISEH